MFKNIHLFHKWEKWGDVETEHWAIDYFGRRTIVIKKIQYRKCSICGKCQKRYVK